MSGLGKTHLASMLRASGEWFHYSVDYRIGTRYMGELIADDFKRHAMAVPLLRELLLTDSVRIESNITFDNLAPLSTYLGKPGDPARVPSRGLAWLSAAAVVLLATAVGTRAARDGEPAAAPGGSAAGGRRRSSPC